MSLKCPDCHQADSLGTLEVLYGVAGCNQIESSGPDWTGDTEIFFDSSTTVGVRCECGWEYEGENWIDQLEE